MTQVIMHDQEMMDWLEEHYADAASKAAGEPADVMTFYGHCLQEFGQVGMPDEKTCAEYVAALDNLMAEIGAPFKVIKLVAADDDGYTWEFEHITSRS